MEKCFEWFYTAMSKQNDDIEEAGDAARSQLGRFSNTALVTR